MCPSKGPFSEGGCQTEVVMKSLGDGNDLRADIAGYFGRPERGVAPVAIEVQCSSYSPAYP